MNQKDQITNIKLAVASLREDVSYLQDITKYALDGLDEITQLLTNLSTQSGTPSQSCGCKISEDATYTSTEKQRTDQQDYLDLAAYVNNLFKKQDLKEFTTRYPSFLGMR